MRDCAELLMQSETRWSCPPSDSMLTSAHLDVMAKAILSGEQERDDVAARLVHVLGRNWRWIRPLAGRLRETPVTAEARSPDTCR